MIVKHFLIQKDKILIWTTGPNDLTPISEKLKLINLAGGQAFRLSTI
jgi:hypothetical protein